MMGSRTPKSDLNALKGLGLFLRQDFLAPDLCRDLILQAGSGRPEAATIVRGNEIVTDPTIRRAECFDLRRARLEYEVLGGLDRVMAEIAGHFGTSLSGYEAPQIVRYPVGGFYRPHADCDDATVAPTVAQTRRVSCVVFLNSAGPSTEQACFVGGALAFFGLAERPTAENCKTFLRPQANLLVAFKSDCYHEVLPVWKGVRWTLVTWFH